MSELHRNSVHEPDITYLQKQNQNMTNDDNFDDTNSCQTHSTEGIELFEVKKNLSLKTSKKIC